VVRLGQNIMWPSADMRITAMIHEMSASAQFITTTFRPEMLAEANKFYGVLFDARKVSTIRTIEQKDAQEFVDVSV
jgi:structural maintenance of chromosome 3 (chondroitin sulfate proteoglycan 6)